MTLLHVSSDGLPASHSHSNHARKQPRIPAAAAQHQKIEDGVGRWFHEFGRCGEGGSIMRPLNGRTSNEDHVKRRDLLKQTPAAR